MVNLRAVPQQIDYQLQISCSGLREFVVPDLNAIILKTNNFLDFFVQFLESTSTFKHFEKEDDRQSYFISEITECERLG